MHATVRTLTGPPPGALPRPDGEVHVWQANLDPPPAPAEELEAVLTPDERARGARFRHRKVSEQFVRSRGLLRLLLAAYLGCPPAKVPIGYAADGKPVLVEDGSGLEFNVTHAGGLAVVAVAERPVGVDVEAVRPVQTMDALVERFFAAPEREQYRTLPPELRAEAFLRGWTCKEAVLKGIGCGTRDLDRCAVDLDPRRPARVVGPPATAAGWAVACWEPAAGYIAAAAVQGSRELELRCEAGPR